MSDKNFNGYPEEDKKKKRELIVGKVIDEIRKSVRGKIKEKVTIIKRNDKDGGEYREYTPLSNSNWDHPSKNKTELGEAKARDYKAEYKKYGSSTKAKKYRAELNKYNRQKGTYGNGDKKDASHKGGKIVGFEAESKNRGRAEKSRLKKEEKLDEFNKAHFLNLIKMEIESIKGQIAYAKDKVNYKGTEDWVKKEFKAVLKDKIKDLKDIIAHYNRVKKLKEGKLTESKAVDKVLYMADHGYGKLGGRVVDGMSANLFKQVYEKSGSTAKAKIDKMSEKQIYGLMIRIWNKFGKQVRI